MADVVAPDVRSRMMAGIRRTNTKPELMVRRALHARGFRYRLHARNLPGKPDIVLPKYRAVIFVNGCFWHGHNCHLFRWPKTREAFWREKIERNIAKDEAAISKLEALGWRVATIWECALKRADNRGPEIYALDIENWLCSDTTSARFLVLP
ncbi:MAG: DNA mismatch endonuclease Vsr [Sphingomonadaceae bacterium]|nr:DNA mismatch endonuclease Vsr [Sphingomonadaceae bacterium]